MQPPPFPFVLVALTAFFGWLAVTESSPWVRWAAAAATLVCAAAAVYQVRPQREPGEPVDDDPVPEDPS
jgi:hypothetical protein